MFQFSTSAVSKVSVGLRVLDTHGPTRVSCVNVPARSMHSKGARVGAKPRQNSEHTCELMAYVMLAVWMHCQQIYAMS